MYKANNKASIKLFSSFSVILSLDENYFHKIFIAVYTAVFRFMGGIRDQREVLHRDTNKTRPRSLSQDINNTPSLSVTDDDRQPSVTILMERC